MCACIKTCTCAYSVFVIDREPKSSQNVFVSPLISFDLQFHISVVFLRGGGGGVHSDYAILERPCNVEVKNLGPRYLKMQGGSEGVGERCYQHKNQRVTKPISLFFQSLSMVTKVICTTQESDNTFIKIYFIVEMFSK